MVGGVDGDANYHTYILTTIRTGVVLFGDGGSHGERDDGRGQAEGGRETAGRQLAPPHPLPGTIYARGLLGRHL